MSQKRYKSRWYEVSYKGTTPSGKAISIHGVEKFGDTKCYPTDLIPVSVIEMGPQRHVRPLVLMMVKIPDNWLSRFRLTPEDAIEGYENNDDSA